MDFEAARRRYMSDPLFHSAVETMVSWIDQLEIAPGEMRQMAVFAQLVHLERKGYTWQLEEQGRGDGRGEG